MAFSPDTPDMAGPIYGDGSDICARIPRTPILRTGGLFASRVFCITEWNDLGDGRIEALHKFDVSEEFYALVKSMGLIWLADVSDADLQEEWIQRTTRRTTRRLDDKFLGPR